MISEALKWRARGFSVLPILPGLKKPALGWTAFTTNQTDETVAAHWAMHPDHLVAVVVGDHFIVDCDDQLAEDTYRMLGAEPFCTMRTARGHHYWFALPEGCPRVASRGDSAPGYIDIKTGKNYVVVSGPDRQELSWSELRNPISREHIEFIYSVDGEQWPFPERQRGEHAEWTGGDEFELGEMAEILSHIRIDDLGYSDYLAVVAGVHDKVDGDDIGLEMLLNITELADNQEETVRKWDSFTSGLPGGTTWSTVCEMARAAGADLKAIGRKWSEQRTKAEMLRAVAQFQPAAPVPPVPATLPVAAPAPAAYAMPTAEPRATGGFAIYGADAQMEVFRGCVYVASHDGIMMPNGEVLKPAQFNSMMPGGDWVLSQDKTTRKPFEAFTSSHICSFPKVNRMAFRPEMPSMAVFEAHGIKYVNAYVPHPGERAKGDVTPFLRHLELLIPDAGDRHIVLSWCAGVVQNPGLKAKWGPVLIGTQGNGKSLVGECVSYAVGRNHTVKPRANQLGEKFNSWIENKLLAIIEEIHTGGRRELMDALKPVISDERVEVEGKGRDSLMIDNRCNFFMASNHKDAIMKTEDDRRYAIVYCAQQSKAEKLRDGMNKEYFVSMFEWLAAGGYAAVADWLDNYQVDVSLLLGDAPDTSMLAEIIAESRSPVQQLVLDACDMEQPGFMGGLILSDALASMLKESGYKLAPRTQSKVIEEIGYIRHPMLPEGKLKMAGKCVRVYCKEGHPVSQVTDVRAVIERQAQAAMADKFAAAAQ